MHLKHFGSRRPELPMPRAPRPQLRCTKLLKLGCLLLKLPGFGSKSNLLAPKVPHLLLCGVDMVMKPRDLTSVSVAFHEEGRYGSLS
ncbi:hypothetical protein GUJ93_ZPchr0016g2538 [Zizania palustris]|uniref:Uncharacterized protein n=1 Tax=Zizania palustris TaxID=103762 RepID=A0A8J5SYZ3_ZIZPA|nr:hypothetical protein GUJ93_ZPchr0016g2538 [Zizania palustris]